jgi:phage/plasmid-associated DNA primase
LGGTDCGKTVLTKAINSSLGEYVGAFNAETMAHNKSTNDEAQQMRWVMLSKNKRLIISNEVKIHLQFSGNVIKKNSSGGDPLVGRTHGKEETTFNTHFLAICLMNDLPEITPYDAAVDNRIRVFNWDKTYVDNPINNKQLKKDLNIEIEILTLQFKRCFIGILIKSYQQFMENNRIDETPEEVKNAKLNWIGEKLEINIINKFVESFEITNIETDYIRSSDIENWLKELKTQISIKKFSIELKKYCDGLNFNNVDSKDKKILGKSCKCWFGIKHVVFEEDEEEI